MVSSAVAEILFALSFAALARAAWIPGERDLRSYTYEQYDREFPDRLWSSAPMGWTDGIGVTRRDIFQANLEWMRAHNDNPHKTWFAAPNEFTDWTNEEFRASRTTGPLRGNGLPLAASGLAEGGDGGSTSPDLWLAGSSSQPFSWLPESVDWRLNGSVSAVKDQGGCGSCWSFAAAETLESALALADGLKAPPVLSEQQIVSCMPNPDACGGTGGCNGATAELAFNYTSRVGLSLEVDYPYHIGAKCSPNALKPNVTNDGFVKLQPNNYSELIGAVATKGPIAIAVAAGSIGWQNYGGGVFGKASGTCGFVHDHAVQLVGYGSDKGNMYWLVRNSWGADWGEKGYVRIRRYGENEPCGVDKYPLEGEACKGDNKPRTYCGVCGILGSSSYPTGVRRVPRFLV